MTRGCCYCRQARGDLRRTKDGGGSLARAFLVAAVLATLAFFSMMPMPAETATHCQEMPHQDERRPQPRRTMYQISADDPQFPVWLAYNMLNAGNWKLPKALALREKEILRNICMERHYKLKQGIAVTPPQWDYKIEHLFRGGAMGLGRYYPFLGDIDWKVPMWDEPED